MRRAEWFAPPSFAENPIVVAFLRKVNAGAHRRLRMSMREYARAWNETLLSGAVPVKATPQEILRAIRYLDLTGR